MIGDLGDDDAAQRPANVRLTLMTGCLVFTAQASFLVSHLLGVPGHVVPLWLRGSIVVFVGAVTASLWAHRRSASVARIGASFALVVLPFLVTFSISDSALAAGARHGVQWEMFFGLRLWLFVIAALSPSLPRWLAPALFVTGCAEGVALWFILDLGAPGAGTAPREPWVSLSSVLLAAVLYRYRGHQARLEREAAVARTESLMLRTTNDAFLAVKDMANTPLQSLEIALALLDERHPSDPVIHGARRSAARLRELARVLPVHEVTTASVDETPLEQLRSVMTRSPA
jgi:hypothetical protein